jgi:streptogramin lyase
MYRSPRALFVAALLLLVPQVAESVTFRELAAESGAFIVPGPDGALWYSHNSSANDGVGRISVAGEYTRVDIPGLFPNKPWGIVTAFGGLWFTDLEHNVIRHLSSNGSWSEFPIPSPAGSITSGKDGSFWFTTANKIGRMTKNGQVTEFSVPTAAPFLGTITAGPDGNLWFTERQGDKIGRITPSGQITEFPLRQGSFPFSITVGPDGHLWFTQPLGRRIGRISTAGQLTEYELHAGAEPSQIVAGPDGNLWFTDSQGGHIGRITPAGMITEFPVPTPAGEPGGLTFGPDGNLWFLYVRASKVVRMTLGGTPVNGPCTASESTLCIDDAPGDRRFQVEVEYETTHAGGLSGKGKAIALASLGVARGGLFWFFSEDNPELVVKILNGCATNQKYWVFISGGTNVGMIITVSDTVTGEVHTYYNRENTPFAPIQDTSALSCGN